jgi:uncharacterized membrane protein YfcA
MMRRHGRLAGSGRGFRKVLGCIAIGLVAGFMSGVFGVGGGIVVIPLLALVLGYSQRLSAGTSLAGIIPSAAVGVISYATHEAVAWVPALILAGTAVLGAQLGTWVSPRVRTATLSWAFVGFLVLVAVSLFFILPTRDSSISLTTETTLILVGCGVLSGALSGLLGVGGGIIVVPAMILFIGSSDLVARGTSLMMMIPAALSGSIGNLMRDNVNVPVAALIGMTACVTTPLGAWTATSLDPRTSNVLLIGFLVLVTLQLAVRTARTKT